jgi:hypothetical protein
MARLQYAFLSKGEATKPLFGEIRREIGKAQEHWIGKPLLLDIISVRLEVVWLSTSRPAEVLARTSI